MAEKVLNARDAKLIQWLDEAHAKESELITSLTAHIKATEKMAYKKRLRKHLTETRDHRRKVAARIKKLGGSANATGTSDPVGTVAGKAVAAVKGQVGAARAAVTPQPETHLRNAQEELREEQVEIALYTRIETLANEVGDDDTAKLARAIRRDEERMAKFLQAELVRLVKDVVRAEIPRDQRAPARRSTRRRSSPARTAPRARAA
jgi:ferritin-like metal-binding protein YciE